MSPYGGDPVRGFDDSDAALDALAQFFRGGEATVEVVETYTSGDLAVLVVIERQHGTIGNLPEQDWSLRVTWVFRRTAQPDWETRTSSCGRARACHPPRSAGSTRARRVTVTRGLRAPGLRSGALSGVLGQDALNGLRIVRSDRRVDVVAGIDFQRELLSWDGHDRGSTSAPSLQSPTAATS